MSKKKKIILWMAGIFLFFGVVDSFDPSNTNVKSTASFHSTQTTISPIKSTVSVFKVTLIPTATPTLKLLLTSTPIPTNYIAPTAYYAPQTQYVQPTTPPAANQSNGLSNDNYYTNVDGNQVHSPAYSTNGSAPAGATAQCNDGTYSFSQHHGGTCSGHSGVASWL